MRCVTNIDQVMKISIFIFFSWRGIYGCALKLFKPNRKNRTHRSVKVDKWPCTSSTISSHLRLNSSTLAAPDSFTDTILLFMASTCQLQTRNNNLLFHQIYLIYNRTRRNGTSAKTASTLLCLASIARFLDSTSDLLLFRCCVASSRITVHSFSNCFLNSSICATEEGKQEVQKVEGKTLYLC